MRNHIRRRDVITLLGGAAAAWPLGAGAQQQGIPVIGFLGIGPPIESNVSGLRKGLSQQGYEEGRNVAIVFRNTDQYDRLPALAAELVRLRVAVIVTAGNINTAQAAKAATSTIPVVVAIGFDPVRAGLVASLNRPGGNVTGVSYQNSEIEPKRLEMLRELVPQAATIAFLVNPTNSEIEQNLEIMLTAARSVGQKIIVLRASTANEIDTVFATLAEQRAGGLLVIADGFFASRRDQLITLAALHRIPAVYFDPGFVPAGGLMSYSDDRLESWRHAGLYVGRILKGEKPADLPVLQPVKFEFGINLKTAKTLGIEFPTSFHLRADVVVE